MDSEFDTFFRAIPEDWYDWSDGNVSEYYKWFGVIQLSDDTLGLLDEIGWVRANDYAVPDFDNTWYFIEISDSGMVYAWAHEDRFSAKRDFDNAEIAYSQFCAEAESEEWV